MTAQDPARVSPEWRLSRRTLLAGGVAASAALVSAAGGGPDHELGDVLRRHVAVAESSKDKRQLWGRIGGSAEERESARLLASQLARYSDSVALEPVPYRNHRVSKWSLRVNAGAIASAMPVPHDALFPDGPVRAPLAEIRQDADWPAVRGKWAFVRTTWEGSVGATGVRQRNQYRTAVESGAAGLIFALPTGPGVWRAVPPIDKPFAELNTLFADNRRPIPCFCVDESGGRRLGDGGAVEGVIACERESAREGLNAAALLRGRGEFDVALLAHLDCFFSGAVDNSTGIAALVGIARRLHAIPRHCRIANIWIAGQSSHHEGGLGTRAFLRHDAARAARLQQVFVVEHVEANDGSNELRRIYLGARGWAAARAAIPSALRDSGLMKGSPEVVDACISDQFTFCQDPAFEHIRTFCLIQSPRSYHTDHDTLALVDPSGIARAVDFHVRMLQATGAIL